jgi:hypothetical protein
MPPQGGVSQLTRGFGPETKRFRLGGCGHLALRRRASAPARGAVERDSHSPATCLNEPTCWFSACWICLHRQTINGQACCLTRLARRAGCAPGATRAEAGFSGICRALCAQTACLFYGAQRVSDPRTTVTDKLCPVRNGRLELCARSTFTSHCEPVNLRWLSRRIARIRLRLESPRYTVRPVAGHPFL